MKKIVFRLEKLKNVTYYRVDIAKAPLAKKKYRVRMAPTLSCYKRRSYRI